MKGKILCLVLGLLLLTGCGADDSEKKVDPLVNLSETHRVIIDTDTAGDDSLAIMIAAKAPNVTIEGVTVLARNVPLDQAANNALMSLETVDCEAEVYLGAKKSLDGVERETFSVYGDDGMGDADLVHPKRTASDIPAVDFILETVRNNPGEIEIVTLGPVTNIAMAIKRDPVTMAKVKRVWSMGTTGLGHGNATPVAEFNVYKDAKAYKMLLDSGIAMTVVGLDLCEREDALFSAEQLDEMNQGNHVQKFASLAFGKLLTFRQQTQGVDNVDICDALMMSHLIWSDITTKSVMCNASCVAERGETYGEVIFYRSDMIYDTMPQLGDPHVTLVTEQKVGDLYDRINAMITS